MPLQRSLLKLRAGSGGTAGLSVSRLSQGVCGGNNMKIFEAKAQKLVRGILRVNRGTGSESDRTVLDGSPPRMAPSLTASAAGRTEKKMAAPYRKSSKAVQKDGGPDPEVRPGATHKMAPPGPELSPGHTKDGGERPPRLREAFILLPDLRPDPDPRPVPAAPSRRAASRCGDGAGRSAAPGAGGRFAGGGRHRCGQPPLGAAAQARDPRQSPPARPAPLRSRSVPPCPGDAVGAAPPPPPPGSDPRRQIRRRALQEIVAGAPSFPSVAVGVPDASGRTDPVAFMSNVLCCVCLQNCHERKYFRGASLQIRPEDARRFQPGGKELWKKSSLKTASGDHQVFQPRRTRREMRESGSNS
ncbi:WAS/WASL-interacting protein family member 1-like isoform X1 [Manacus candei]|uniref:WAS/WASL-interacting protein family member 1-like isoform X1 n=1 Tax=Manacus candei TaxID=415023 RepID=UPI002225E9E0|nr:WAS/WASL-interacting protein family member 1-like isoform X1 [Manacus candei]XP_051628530.1 WAS/WASL-interacting protein family member 1-like isoform X2 [Manacus candei]XP_051628532.1 WAS/WASL-interacting protein family member 1-like isoform X1 [Manacus candei]XP_051628533.1 WAS/WASL-interacting protein family member 1-like isoform X1 [Manacus candei]